MCWYAIWKVGRLVIIAMVISMVIIAMVIIAVASVVMTREAQVTSGLLAFCDTLSTHARTEWTPLPLQKLSSPLHRSAAGNGTGTGKQGC